MESFVNCPKCDALVRVVLKSMDNEVLKREIERQIKQTQEATA